LQRAVFLDASHQAVRQVSELFDFVWPTETALQRLRGRVQSYRRKNPAVTASDLDAKFAIGKRIGSGRIKKAFVDLPWEHQEAQLGSLVLIKTFAIYEAWAEGAVTELGVPGADCRKVAGWMQWPRTSKEGVSRALAMLARPVSLAIDSDFFPAMENRTGVIPGAIDHLLTAYRYFKVCRNVILHQGGRVTDELLEGFKSFNSIPFHAKFTLPEVVPPPVSGAVTVSAYAAAGFGEVVLLLIRTLDTALLRGERAEELLLRRWRERFQKRPQLSWHATTRARQVAGCLASLGFPHPKSAPNVAARLAALGAI
jgi:hypothetical protein